MIKRGTPGIKNKTLAAKAILSSSPVIIRNIFTTDTAVKEATVNIIKMLNFFCVKNCRASMPKTVAKKVMKNSIQLPLSILHKLAPASPTKNQIAGLG